MTQEAQTNQAAEFDLDLFDDVPPDQFGPALPVYPSFQWVNGSQRQRALNDLSYTGGWLLPEEQAPTEDFPLPKWEFVTDSGAIIPGYAASSLKVAVIAYRRCWTVGAREAFQRFPWDHFDAAREYAQELGERHPRGRVHALVAIQGLEAYGPFVLNLAGMAARAFTEAVQAIGKILKVPATRLIRASRGQKHPGVPLRSFWATIGYKRAADGSPVFEKVGKEGASNFITPPSAWDLPAKPIKRWEELQPFFVGKPNLDLFSAWYEEAADWLTAWDAKNERPTEPRNGEVVEPGEEGEIDIPF